MPDFNRDKCQQRNRLAARRDGIDGAPLRLLRRGAVAVEVLAHLGSLPASETEALERINALLGAEVEPLTAADVWVHYAEAANDNFIEDRFLFLDATTLRNVARDAERGVAFMNSHRTGGLSHPSELPFGRTFAGKFEEYRDEAGRLRQRALVGFYMLRGKHPNGANGPSTDDLHAAIEGGTLFDVSVGLYGGDRVCDVCGHELHATDERGRDLCPHVPGTLRGMNADQQEAQRQRGVCKALASYSLVNARMGEISGVFDGAVPGAGFRKALSLHRQGGLDAATLSACRDAYVTLARGDFDAQAPSREAAGQLAETLLAFWHGETPDDFEGAPDALSFETQLDLALDALSGCIDRGERMRRLSRGRRAQLEALQNRCSALLATAEPETPDAALAIREKALRLRARAVLAGAAECHTI